jgi:hypothetical protein
MKTIWKFPISLTDRQTIQMPEGAKILDVQDQHGGLKLWALVDPTAPQGPRNICIHGTGHAVVDVGPHITTFQIHGGDLVFHVFDGAR